MPQYKEGTARALSAAHQRIELVGGTTTNHIVTGDLFRFRADVASAWFEVSSIVSATIFDLTGPYNAAQAFDTLLPYLIVRDFTPNFEIPELAPGDIAIREVFTEAMRVIDGILSFAARAEFSFVGALSIGDKPFRWYSPLRMTTRTVHISVGSPATSPVTVDVKKNGSTVFTDSAARPTIGVGQYSAEVPCAASLVTNDYLTVSIIASGGSDLVVQVRF